MTKHKEIEKKLDELHELIRKYKFAWAVVVEFGDGDDESLEYGSAPCGTKIRLVGRVELLKYTILQEIGYETND